MKVDLENKLFRIHFYFFMLFKTSYKIYLVLRFKMECLVVDNNVV